MPTVVMSRVRCLVAGLVLCCVSGQMLRAQDAPSSAAPSSTPSTSAPTTTVPLEKTNAWRMSHDYYVAAKRAPHDFDLIHQDIELSHFDWLRQSCVGRVTTRLVATGAGFDSVRLSVWSSLTITAATDLHGKTLAFTQKDNAVTVQLGMRTRHGDTARFVLDYTLAVKDTGTGIIHFVHDSGIARRPQQFWALRETWFPTYGSPDDKETWSVTVTAPAKFSVISNGILVGITPAANGERTTRWRLDHPASTYLSSIVIAPVATIRDVHRANGRTVPLEYNVYPADSAIASAAFSTTAASMAVYERLTGIPYPWPRYAQTVAVDFEKLAGGLENVTSTTMYDFLPDARTLIERPRYTFGVVPHELAHQWFGDYITLDNWNETWINEGFAEFMTGQFARAQGGEAGEDQFFFDTYNAYLDTDHRSRVAIAGPSDAIVYNKGSLVLRMLKQYLGDDKFWKGMHQFLATHPYGNVTTNDFTRAMSAAAGEPLDWFTTEWVYQAGHPEFTVSATYDSAAHRVTLHVAQTQTPRQDPIIRGTDTSYYETPAAFRMPVTIRIGNHGGDVVKRVWLESREQVVTIDGVKSAPTFVVFDDNNEIIKTLTFEQPTTWLAGMLGHDADVWNNWWAIGKLVTHGNEAAAVTALATAATRSRHALTRAQATGVFGPAAGPVALDVIRSGLRDSSWNVRQSALVALASYGPQAPTDLIAATHQLFDSDPSYTVQAAAVYAIGQIDPAGRDAVFAKAMTMPSYRDIIHTTARAQKQAVEGK